MLNTTIIYLLRMADQETFVLLEEFSDLIGRIQNAARGAVREIHWVRRQVLRFCRMNPQVRFREQIARLKKHLKIAIKARSFCDNLQSSIYIRAANAHIARAQICVNEAHVLFNQILDQLARPIAPADPLAAASEVNRDLLQRAHELLQPPAAGVSAAEHRQHMQEHNNSLLNQIHNNAVLFLQR